MSADLFWSSGADSEGPFRYRLWRKWNDGQCLVWCLLNPSTADAQTTDPTLKRMMHWSREWGYGGLVVVNAFAYRSSRPTDLRDAASGGFDIIGPRNDDVIQDACGSAGGGRDVIVAWGKPGWTFVRERLAAVNLLLGSRPLWCLGRNNDGSPKHAGPLAMVPLTAQKVTYP